MDSRFRVPNVVHLVKTDDLPVKRFLFLNILSILHNLNPETLYLHVSNAPRGFFWNLTLAFDVKQRIVVAPIKPHMLRLEGMAKMPVFREDWAAAHKSDIIRMNILKSSGGIYLDTDILVLQSFDDLRKVDFTMGLQTQPPAEIKVCNGVMLANPQSKFLGDWYSGLYNASFSSCWDCHSIELPSRLWEERRNKNVQESLQVLPVESFFDPSFSRADLHLLFGDRTTTKGPSVSPPYPGKHAVHLWNRVSVASGYLSRHRIEGICGGSSMYNEMLRFALNGTAFLTKLCGQEF